MFRRLLRQIQEERTYRDLSGRRRLRRYALVTEGLLLAALALWAWSACQRAKVTAIAQATPAPVELPTRTPTPLPTPTPTRPVDEVGCPADPQDWTLVDPAPREGPHRWLRVEPACVYRGLARSVAALMLTYMGWTHEEARQALGLPRFPLRYHPVITVTGELDRPWVPDFYTAQQRGLPSGAVCDPEGCPRFWALRMGAPRPELSFYFFVRGCFYPRQIIGGQVQEWGMPYPVICAVSQDVVPYWWVGMSADETELFRHEYRDLWGRSTLFFGYDLDLRIWVYIGSSRMEDPETKKEIARAVREQGRQFAWDRAARHGQPVWDGAWLKEAFGLEMKPPPEGWEKWPDRMREFYERRGEALERAKEEWSR